MNFCPAHQTAVGPRGCPQCLREEVLLRAHEGSRFWRMVLFVGVPFMALLALGAWLVVQKAPAKDVRLDATPFRASIEGIEDGFYATDRLTYEMKDLLRQSLGQLPLDLRRLPPSLAQRRALDGLEMFCVMNAQEVSDDSYDVMAARTKWESLRDAHFRPAPWFRASTTALEQAQQSGEARGIPGDSPQYQATIDQLRMAAARAESVLQGLAENPMYADSETHQRWQSGRADLKADMDRILQQMPVSFPGMDGSWRRAYYELGRAQKAVASLLSPNVQQTSQMPSPSIGSYRMLGARSSLDSAQSALDSARR